MINRRDLPGLLLGAILISGASQALTEASPATTIAESLARLVNIHALPSHMISGNRAPDGHCALNLDRDFTRAANADLAKAQDRVFRELERSSIEREIRRFNAPRTVSDEQIFRVDESTCSPVEYRPQISEFKPPQSRTFSELTVQYAGEKHEQVMVLEISSGGKSRTLPVVRKAASTGAAPGLDLSAPEGPVVSGGEDLVLRWGKVVLADWSIERWPMLRNVHLDANTKLRVHAGRNVTESGQVGSPSAGSRIAFPEGAVLTVLRRDSRGFFNPVANLSWRQTRVSETLYRGDAKGIDHWARPPSNFELQIVKSLRELPQSGKRSVTLSLRPELSQQLQDTLNTATKPYSRLEKDWNIFGSVVLMDALSGEYLGVAGYPAATTPRRLPNEEFVVDERFREEFLTRRNIGSVAKAPIAHAIIASTPALAGLSMKPYPGKDQNSVLGIALPKPFNEAGNSARCGNKGGYAVDIECFLRLSLNRYAATLLTLAAIPSLDKGDLASRLSGTKPLGNEAVSIPGKSLLVDHQPKALLWAGTPSAEQLQGLPWVRYAQSEYDIDVAFANGTGFASSDVHHYVWRLATRESDRRQAGFQMISPEKENLRLNQARDLRGNYLPIILGGGESLWSSAKVAETFARTVSGTKVYGSFVQVNRAQAWADLKGIAEPDVVAARQRYLSGLASVFPAGTGTEFNPGVQGLHRRAQEKGLKLTVYAKSGTPTVQDFESPDEENLAYLHPIDRAFRDGILSASHSPSGTTILLSGKRIDKDLLADLSAQKGGLIGQGPLRINDIRYLARFNTLDALSQSEICKQVGATLSCLWPPDTLRKQGEPAQLARRIRTDKGRNYAVYAELRQASAGKVCRAVSMAVSFSEEGAPFTNMLKQLLDSNKGPLAKALNLDASSNADMKESTCGEPR